MASSSTSSPKPRLAKIVITLGPASVNRLDELILAGVNVFRLNFSHSKGDFSLITPVIQNIRETSKRLDAPVAILGDLQGPKFRIGDLKDHKPVELKDGAKLKFSVGTELGDATHIYTKNAPVITGLSVGHKVLLDDGTMELKVLERITETEIVCEVIHGGTLNEKKGINVPDIAVSSKLSEKDKQDALFAVEQGLDYIAASFVQNGDDIKELRAYMQEHSAKAAEKIFTSNPSRIKNNVSWTQKLPLIIAKIEKPQAIDCIREILEATDGIMVARGDLGVEMSLEKVPAMQKMLIDLANEMQKPVITATQMLQSMIDNPVPTRAEVSDVANAVFDGSDAVMLSAESAVGKFPIETVKTMARIVEEAERSLDLSPNLNRQLLFRELSRSLVSAPGAAASLPFYETVARCAVTAAKDVGASAIIVISYSGLMANRISKYKSNIPIIAFTPEPHAYRRMAMLGGVHPLLIHGNPSTDETMTEVEAEITKRKLVSPGEIVVFCAGTTQFAGVSNSMRVYKFGEYKKAT